ncbi:hypothetical protein D3C72_2218100 [compost metagenome]
MAARTALMAARISASVRVSGVLAPLGSIGMVVEQAARVATADSMMKPRRVIDSIGVSMEVRPGRRR